MSFRSLCSVAALAAAGLFSWYAADGQQPAKPPAAAVAGIPVNYDEALVGTYTLPDPLVLANGKPVRDAKTWNTQRRPEIVRLFEENEYGRAPGRPPKMGFDVFDKGTPALDGKATRRQVTVYFSEDRSGPKMDLLIYLPAGAKKPAPLLLNLGFSANSSAVDDPGIKPGEVWGRGNARVPAPRGGFGRINPAPFLAEGIGVATIYYGDIDPDFLGGGSAGRAQAVSEARTDGAGAQRVGLDRGLGLGTQPRHGLPGNRQGRGREARRHPGCVAAGQDGDVGGRARHAHRHGDRELLG
jgi:hypothetical protein